MLNTRDTQPCRQPRTVHGFSGIQVTDSGSPATEGPLTRMLQLKQLISHPSPGRVNPSLSVTGRLGQGSGLRLGDPKRVWRVRLERRHCAPPATASPLAARPQRPAAAHTQQPECGPAHLTTPSRHGPARCPQTPGVTVTLARISDGQPQSQSPAPAAHRPGRVRGRGAFLPPAGALSSSLRVAP
jgi:hypothetical protein